MAETKFSDNYTDLCRQGGTFTAAPAATTTSATRAGTPRRAFASRARRTCRRRSRRRAQGEAYGASEKAVNEGIQRGKKLDVKAERQLVCPDCGAMTRGAKFCPECGVKLAVQGKCPSCSADVTPGAKFCPECGERQPV